MLLETLPLMATAEEMAKALNAAEQRYITAHFGSRCFNSMPRACTTLGLGRYAGKPWPPPLSLRIANATPNPPQELT
jgi:hypothetical protein